MAKQVMKTKRFENLNSFTDSELVDYILFHYKRKPRTPFFMNFRATVNFRMGLVTGWIFIAISNNHERIAEFLKSQKCSDCLIGQKDTVYGFYTVKNTLTKSDLDILKKLMKLVGEIQRIEVETLNVTFKRFSPLPLKRLCQNVIKLSNIKPDFSKTVLERLELVEIA